MIICANACKTIIGHTEGAAGLAGLLKGVGMINNGIIPPNMLFNNLNPDILPFYKGLRVPTVQTPWPQLPEGVPRRVSVNSFGKFWRNFASAPTSIRNTDTFC